VITHGLQLSETVISQSPLSAFYSWFQKKKKDDSGLIKLQKKTGKAA
jgi:hypothetical protein